MRMQRHRAVWLLGLEPHAAPELNVTVVLIALAFCRLAFLVRLHKIETAFVANLDQAGFHIVPTGGGRTYAEKGSKTVSAI